MQALPKADAIDLEEALKDLAQRDGVSSSLVELVLFGGMSIRKVAPSSYSPASALSDARRRATRPRFAQDRAAVRAMRASEMTWTIPAFT